MSRYLPIMPSNPLRGRHMFIDNFQVPKTTERFHGLPAMSSNRFSLRSLSPLPYRHRRNNSNNININITLPTTHPLSHTLVSTSHTHHQPTHAQQPREKNHHASQTHHTHQPDSQRARATYPNKRHIPLRQIPRRNRLPETRHRARSQRQEQQQSRLAWG